MTMNKNTKTNMATPIVDFVEDYAAKRGSRFHMPGHKGHSFLGCESFDITEIAGADSLYEADGIIAESEKNATELFGTGRTVFSTEGSSQCIRAMLYLAITNQKTNEWSNDKKCGKPVVVAARNVHKSFVYAAALLDIEVKWLWPEGGLDSLCACLVTPEGLTHTLRSMKNPPAAVYVTCPDYLGGMLDIESLARVCHQYDTILAVDNAHGSYLHFLDEPKHPMDLGADICCDSAHKTLPVLTGGAYLHISAHLPEVFREYAKEAMALFGSTSPSYLTLASLDLCNRYLACEYRNRLRETVKNIQELRKELMLAGWQLEGSEPLKVTVGIPEGMTGGEIAEKLRQSHIECEYADPQYIVFMITPENTKEDFQKLKKALGVNQYLYKKKHPITPVKCKSVLSIREAIFAKHEVIPISEAKGRICASPTVSCPPAIPIVVSGEVVDEETLTIFKFYGILSLDVVISDIEKK